MSLATGHFTKGTIGTADSISSDKHYRLRTRRKGGRYRAG